MSPTPLSADAQVEQLLRGTDHVYTAAELKSRIESAAKENRPLRVKLGMDPTAPDLHLGHAVVLRKLRQFQDLGHKAVLIIGDFTATIGDPTGKTKTRPPLSPEQVERNAQTYFDQAGKILDLSPDKVEVRRNSEWFDKMTMRDGIKLKAKITVARLLERDTFQERLKAGLPIAGHELDYPLLQGWDSVVIQSDVELGGTDQTFNNLVGRQLQEHEGQPPQIVLVLPILVGIDGVNKMSKSLDNYVAIADSPREQFGRTMKIPDTLMANWFEMCTTLPADQVALLLDGQQTHPRLAKEVLAKAIVTQYHGAVAAEAAADEFKQLFSAEGSGLPTHLEVKSIPREAMKEGSIGILALIKDVGFSASTSEARRLVEGGGVTFAGQKIIDPKAFVTLTGEPVLQVGKRRACKLTIK